MKLRGLIWTKPPLPPGTLKGVPRSTFLGLLLDSALQHLAHVGSLSGPPCSLDYTLPSMHPVPPQGPVPVSASRFPSQVPAVLSHCLVYRTQECSPARQAPPSSLHS